tara:strand:- start:913 stop:1134 length:222 start_codon:yes stop_codon:yes gene_type:complete
MGDSFLGAIIVSVATGALFIAVQTAEKAFRNAGKYAPTSYEYELLRKAGYSSEENKKLIITDLESYPIKYINK